MTTSCASCAEEKANLKRCSRCLQVYYCSKECQHLHWKTHKPFCIPSSQTLVQRVECYRKMRWQLPPGSLIPEIVVPFHMLNPCFSNEHELKLQELSSLIFQHNSSFRTLGLTYLQNVITKEEEQNLMDHTMDYIKVCGCRVEEEHLIQRAEYTLSPAHPTIIKMQKIFGETLGIPCPTMTPNFNYYPCKTTVLHPHQDNLFSADQIGILTVGGSGSVRPLSFCHWVTGHTFTIYVEPRSMYIMDEEVRYEYMHGSNAIIDSDSEMHIHNAIKQFTGQRLSYVLGSNTMQEELSNSSAQVWGDSEQRHCVDKQLGSTLSLLEYLTYVEKVGKLYPDYELLQQALEQLRTRYQKCVLMKSIQK